MRWFEAWKEPLPDGTLRGAEDIFFSPEFEALQAEVNKNDSLQGDARTDWELVLEMASSILSTSAKDIWVYCYGCRAAYAQGGLTSLCAGLEIMTRDLDSAWDNLSPSPSRPARRAAPFTWLVGKLETLMPVNAFPVEKEEVYARFREVLNSLQALLDERMGESAPSFRNILRAIPEKKPARPAPEAQPAPLPAAGAAQVIAGLDSDGRVPDSILPQLLRAANEQAQQLAGHYLAQDFRDWRVYLLHRAALWSTVTQLPPANGEKVTQLRLVLPLDKALSYAAAVDAGQYEGVLPQLERSAAKAPFWFDGHHLVVRCLEALGLEEARDIVCGILSCFMRRYPELTGYKFHDGTPFASPAAIQWLQELRRARPGGAGSPAPEAAGEEERAQRDEMLLGEALAIAGEQDFESGLAALGPGAGGKCRQAILHGILQARYCLRAGKAKAGKELLLALYDRLEQWDLLDWEPELGAQIISLLISSGGDKGRGDMRQRLYSLHAATAILSSE